MISFHNYITEQLDNNNLSFKIGSWFKNDEDALGQFTSFCASCREKHGIDEDALKAYYDGFTDADGFVDYVNDNIGQEEPDYYDAFRNIVRAFSEI